MYRANSKRTGFYKTTGTRKLRGIKWKFRQSSAVSGWIPGWNWGIESDNGIVCVSNPGGNLYGLASQTGQELWTHKLEKSNESIYPVVANNTIYLSYRQMDYKTIDEYLLAIDLYSGQKKWEFKFPLNLKTFTFDFALTRSSPAVSNDLIFVGSGNGYLYAINALSGDLIWSFKTTKNKPLTAPAVGKDIVAVYSRDGYLYVIDIFSGEQKWKFEIPLQDRWFLDSQMLLYGFLNQMMKMVAGSTKDLETFSEPMIIDNTIYVGCSNGYLYALN